jgi:hypothetical protein
MRVTNALLAVIEAEGRRPTSPRNRIHKECFAFNVFNNTYSRQAEFHSFGMERPAG